MTSDVLMIGGGVISMAIAIELKLRGAQVTMVSRDLCAAATHAAAGMLAPGAERISDEAMQKLCTRSLYLYSDWTRKLEEFTSINTGYWSCGILAPVYQEQTSRASTAAEFPSSGVWRGQINSKLRSVALAECAINSEATQSQNSKSRSVASGAKQSEVSPSSGSSSSSSPASPAYWLEKEAIHQYQPGLGEEVVGGWWYPEDGQVNNRALAQALLATAKSLGIELKEDITVEGIQQQQRQVVGVQTSAGILHAEHYVLATGAWSNALFPLPVRPVKGQMLSVRVPEFVPDLPLTRVLFGEDIYIVPRRDGRIIIGATVEDVGFTPHNTPVGIQALLQRAIRLFPKIQDYPIEEFWWGFRPATPDELPILGTSPCENLTFATGHYRNGILLAPITATLLADLILEQKIDSLLSDFHYSRFHAKSSTPMHTLPTHRTQNLEQAAPRYANSTQNSELSTLEDSPLQIAGKTFQSRLMTGTGKYRSIQEMQQSVAASRCQIVTVAVRRVQTNAAGHEGLAEALDWTKIWMLPNTAGCKTAEEAIRVARLGREMAKLLGQEDNNFVKLEVIPDQKYLLPDPIGTLQAAEQLVKEGFAVLPYINADPMLAKHLEEAGCATVMPLASPIGSGQGLKTAANIQIIIENAHVPVVVDAGIGAPSEAAQAMEMGADALLINSAIALAQNPPAMAHAMNLAAVAGRLAYLAGRMPLKTYAIASSPLTGTITN